MSRFGNPDRIYERYGDDLVRKWRDKGIGKNDVFIVVDFEVTLDPFDQRNMIAGIAVRQFWIVPIVIIGIDTKQKIVAIILIAKNRGGWWFSMGNPGSRHCSSESRLVFPERRRLPSS